MNTTSPAKKQNIEVIFGRVNTINMGAKILLVDDDTDDHFFFTNAVCEIDPGLQCIVMENGQQALDYLSGNTSLPVMIFLDLNMPLMNGFECLEELKKNNDLKEIPIIIFTTSNSEADRERSMAMGAKTFLTKTVDFTEFKKNIREIIEQSL